MIISMDAGTSFDKIQNPFIKKTKYAGKNKTKQNNNNKIKH